MIVGKPLGKELFTENLDVPGMAVDVGFAYFPENVLKIAAGKYDAELEAIKKTGEKELRKRYAERNIEAALEQTRELE